MVILDESCSSWGLEVTPTVKHWSRSGCLLSSLLLGLGSDQGESFQDGLLVSLFKVHGFIWGQKGAGGGKEISSSPLSSSDSQSYTVVVHLLWPSLPNNSVAFFCCWQIRDGLLSNILCVLWRVKVSLCKSVKAKDAQMLQTLDEIQHTRAFSTQVYFRKTQASPEKGWATRLLISTFLLKPILLGATVHIVKFSFDSC